MPVSHVSAMNTIDGAAPALDQYNRIGPMGMTMKCVDKAASYTLLAEDSGKVFTASAAATFTLPAVTNTGFIAWFVNVADANMTIASAEGDNIVADGDAAADSIAFSTTSHKIGGSVGLVSNGTLWLPLGGLGFLLAVPTVAT